MKYCGVNLVPLHGIDKGANSITSTQPEKPACLLLGGKPGRTNYRRGHSWKPKVNHTNTFHLMVWTISQQPGKSDFSRPIQGPFRSVVLESFPFSPRITFDTGWSSRLNFSFKPQLVKSKMPSQLKNHFHQNPYLVCTGQLNLVVYSFVS